MKAKYSITAITLWHVAIPLLKPFRISSGAVDVKESILVELTTASGHTGWGESSPMSGSFYSAETPESVWVELVSMLVPWLAQHADRPLPELLERLTALPASGFARAGVDGALWDLRAQVAGVPLYRLLGGTGGEVLNGLAVGITETVEELIATIESHLARDGYRRVKVKIQPGWDLEPLSRVREHFGADLVLQTDANASYRVEHIPLFEAMDRFDLVMHEQPFGKLDYEGLALLRKRIHTPICIDETAETLPSLRRSLEQECCDIANVKIQRMGGLTPALEGIALCRRYGIPTWMGTMPELGVASVHALHLATYPNMTFPTDVESSLRWFVDDLVDPLITVSDGFVRLPEAPGTGFVVNREKIARYLLRKHETVIA